MKEVDKDSYLGEQFNILANISHRIARVEGPLYSPTHDIKDPDLTRTLR